MVLMALDHVREFMPTAAHDPLDPDHTTLGLYLTRWITHFCAPVFAFLAGAGVGLMDQRGTPLREISAFLVKRGLWLVALELTVIGWFGWSFAISLRVFVLQVIWALGVSMIVLAALIHLPRRWLALLALGQIFLHNAFDSVHPEAMGPVTGDLWRLLHVLSELQLPSRAGVQVFVLYPLIPWIGVVIAGYLWAPELLQPTDQRRRLLVSLGLGCVLGFLVLRIANGYGDPEPWAPRESMMRTVFSFFRCAKYPPSLAYLLMTLGPMYLLLAWLDRGIPKALEWLVVFGRVPMFYYLLHLPLVHLLVVLTCAAMGRDTSLLFSSDFDPTWTEKLVQAQRFPLGMVYLLWGIAVAILFPLCRKFGDWKRTTPYAWARYL